LTLHILRLRLPNVYLIGGERSVLVDSGGPADVPRILSFLQVHGIEAGKLALILLTHGHWDHAGGAAELRAATKAPVAIHRADADLVRQGINGPVKPTSVMGYVIRTVVNRGYPPFEPDLVLDAEIDLHEFGVAARVVFTPGHTPGSISVLTQANEVIVGDLLMGGFFGGWLLPTRPGLHYFADDLDQLRASVGKVLDLAPSVVHPGHGGPLDPRVIGRMWS
jgi:glyoxylase-like metal-dependent hydrolase (beta-lactamase superfamily II)